MNRKILILLALFLIFSDFSYAAEKILSGDKTLPINGKGQNLKVIRGDKQGLFSVSDNKFLLPVIYDEVLGGDSDGNRLVRLDSHYGIINQETGEFILPVEYENISHFVDESCWILKKAGRYGLYNKFDRKIILPVEYDKIDILYRKERLYLVTQNKHQFFCNENGHKIKKSVWLYNIENFLVNIIAAPFIFIYYKMN